MPQASKPSTTPSLPGAMARRTDGGVASKQAARYISGMPNYGDGQDLANLQAQAPLSASGSPKPASKTAINAAAMQSAQPQQQGPNPAQMMQSQVTPLLAPTQRPDEPVTHGAAMGPGSGPEVLGFQPGQMQPTGQSAKQIVQSLALHPDASPELKNLANLLGK